jgi:tRNA(Ile)-lysidine synthase
MLLRQSGCQAGEKLVVAVSGGVDSMVLLDVLDHLRGSLGLRLHVAHLDHGLRPGSEADARFVAEEARRRGLECTVGRRDVATEARIQRRSLEEEGRRQRYAFLEEVAGQVGAEKIALGHQADDQAETVLLHLLRGSGTGGLGAMQVLRQGRYLRPLLEFDREAIAAYARDQGLAFREDESNQDLRFARNRIRHELLPLLRTYNPRIAQTLTRTARLLQDEDLLLDELAQEAANALVCQRGPGKIALDARRFLDYHIAVQRRVVRALLQGLSAGEGPFDFAHVEQVRAWIVQGDERLRALGAGVWVQGSGGRFILRRGRTPPVEQEIAVPGETHIAARGLVLKVQVLPVDCFASLKDSLGGGRAAFDAERLRGRLLLRSARPGDRFCPLGMEGHKKLSDFLVDLKWPRILRDEILVLALGDEIVWIVGLRPGHSFRVRPDSRAIALVELCECAPH